ncbi:protein mono-ADP-ribosyltransferase PARP12b [Gadus macrocephalus]|uniref:protein mono-ADP-ribosyltransferase PARP12b n=1 Tax=Gadus macrocephalus TaxID=80720 RepID=UPI0028CB375E|nr:protein mono-ADP-ribosyltransferase PARP12b [Gadus macrocephalus]
MSSYEVLRDGIIHHATSVLCSNKGSMASSQLYEQIMKSFDVTQGDFWFIMKCARFEVKRTGLDGDSVVVAKTSLRLCKEYWKGTCYEEKCEELHICKYYVYGNCRFGKNEFRKPCKQCKHSHDLRCPHNQSLLRDCTLQDLPEEDLFLLLMQNDPSLLPEVCVHYNRGGVPDGACTFRDSCTKLHLCLHHAQGRCRFGERCQRLHAVDHRGLKLLQERGLRAGDFIRDLPGIYQNRHHLLAAAAQQASGGASGPQAPTQETLRQPEEFNAIREKRKAAKIRYRSSHPARSKMAVDGPSCSLTNPADAQPFSVSPLGISDLRHQLSSPVIQTDQRTSNVDICLHFLRRRCQFEDQCMLVHFNMPYKWEVLKGGAWRDLRHMEEIELAYCDPEARKSPGSRPVDFLTMTQGSRSFPVRRLTTVSSVTKPPHYTLTTEWVWYYRDNHRSWVEYGQPDSGQRTTSVTSRDLEQAYQKNPLNKVPIMKGFRKYLLSFKDMYQWNQASDTRRPVRRRPRFLSAAGLATLTAR